MRWLLSAAGMLCVGCAGSLIPPTFALGRAEHELCHGTLTVEVRGDGSWTKTCDGWGVGTMGGEMSPQASEVVNGVLPAALSAAGP